MTSNGFGSNENDNFWEQQLANIDMSGFRGASVAGDEDEETTGLLTAEEYDKVIMNVMVCNDTLDGGTDEDTVVELVRWAESARLSSMLLDLVLSGMTLVGLNADGEPFFRTPTTLENDRLMSIYKRLSERQGEE